MIKRIIITLQFDKTGKPEGMTINKENIATNFEAMIILNEASHQTLLQIADNIAKAKSPVQGVKNPLIVRS